MALTVLAVSFVYRLVWVLVAADPMEPGDATLYLDLAGQFREQGLLSPEVQPLPYWPAGYPIFVAAILAVTGSTIAIGVVQLTILTASGWFLYEFASRAFGSLVAWTALVVFAVHPSITGTAAWIAYEPMMLALLVIGVALIHRGVTERAVWALVVGVLVLGLAVTLQSKALTVAVPLTAWVAWRQRQRPAIVAALVVALAVGPGAAILRNQVATGHPVLSTNLGANVVLGNSRVATGNYPGRVLDDACDREWGSNRSRTPSQDRELLRCAMRWVLANPIDAVALWPKKLWYYTAPFTGPLSTTSTHGVDPRRVVPESVRETDVFTALDRGISAAVYVVATLLLFAGAVIALRDPATRIGGFLAVWPIVAFVALTLATFGDARFRLPTVGFVIVLQSVALVSLVTVLRRRSRDRPAVS